MNTLTNNQKVLIAALIGFLIGASAIWVWSVSTTTNSVAEEEATIENEDLTASTGAADVKPEVRLAKADSASNSVLIPKQAAGSEVRFTATLSQAGWVVIHDDRDGSFGNALGARWIPAGAQDNFVPLLRSTAKGKTYHAVLYADNGDKQYTVRGETMLVDANSKPIHQTFVAE